MRDAQPPLHGRGLETATFVISRVVAGNEAAWAFATQAGAYEQLVRCMDAYPNDPDVQSLCCNALAWAGNARERSSSRIAWAAHPDNAARTGAIRAMVAALHAHNAQRNVLFSAATTLALIFARSLLDKRANALAVARDGRAAEALAGALPLALRIAATDDAELLEVLLDALSSLARLDTVCAQQAARPGTLRILGKVLHLYRGSYMLILLSCMVLQSVATLVDNGERAAATDYCIAGLHAALVAHRDLILQGYAWQGVYLLLSGNKRAARRAGAAGLATEAIRALESYASANISIDDCMVGATTAVCSALCELLLADDSCRLSAITDGVVPAAAAMLRAHGTKDYHIASAACVVLAKVFGVEGPHSSTLGLGYSADEVLSLIGDVAAAMRAHENNVNIQTAACAVLAALTFQLLDIAYLLLTRRCEPPDASALARRLTDAGALEATATALRTHAAAAHVLLRNNALFVLIVACSGAPPDGTGPPLQASVAARAAHAGVGAALSAALAQNLPHPDAAARARAVALAAAVARVPVPRACDGCGTTDAPKLKLCSRCLKARFCGDACQRAAWPAHKLVCVRAHAADST